MTLHEEDLQQISVYYAQYVNDDNLEELFNGEMKKLLSHSVGDNLRDDYARGLAIAAATYQKRLKEDPTYAEKLTELGYELASLGSKIDNTQFEKVIKYREKLNQIESIDSLGTVETSDSEIQTEEEKSETSIANDSNGPKKENINEIYISEKLESSEYDNDQRALLGAVLKSYAQTTDLDSPDKSVMFDHVFFNEIMEDKDAMLERIDDKDFLYGDIAEQDLDFGKVPEDVDAHEAATFDAATRIKTYMTLDKRSQNRSFIDVLKHPFNTFKEWRIKNSLEKDIKKRYGLSKETLGKMTKEVLDTTHPKGQDGYEKMSKDFIAFGKDGEVISTETHTQADIQRIGKRDYPEDPDLDAKLEARQKAEEEKARAEEVPEEDEEEMDTSKLSEDTNLEKKSAEKSPFLSNGAVMLNEQVIDNTMLNGK